MSELLIGIIGMFLLYLLGRFLYPEPQHVPIQQELIKMNAKDYLYGVKYNLEEEE